MAITIKTQAQYSENPPAIYTSSSLMSPDRRELYLGHKSGIRSVHKLPDDITTQISSDARHPIDLCCVHENMFVYFPSTVINVAKVKDFDPAFSKSLGELAIAAHTQLKTSSKLGDISNLPRKKEMRNQKGYDRIPLDPLTGELKLDSKSYPILPETVQPKFTLSTKDWYVWLAILNECADSRVALMEFNGHNYFMLSNSYNLVIQRL